VPTLQVFINGKHGKFFLHPVRDFENGDQSSASDAVYSHADVEFSFPGSYLHSGVNTIALQTVEEAEKHVPDACLNYDAIELDSSTKKFQSQQSSAQVIPSVFYTQQGGELHEIVDVFIRYGAPVNRGASMDLAIEGRHYRQPIKGKQDFGEEKLEFELREFPAETRAQLGWNLNGHRRRQEEPINPAKKWTLFLVPHIDAVFASPDLFDNGEHPLF
jgi:hypothetical protein